MSRSLLGLCLFTLIASFPSACLDDVTNEELEAAATLKANKAFDLGRLHPDLHKAWQGYGATLEMLVPSTDDRELVRHWFHLAVMVGDRRLKDPVRMN